MATHPMTPMNQLWALFAAIVFAALFVMAAGMAFFLDRTTQNLAGLFTMLGILGTFCLWLLVRASKHDGE